MTIVEWGRKITLGFIWLSFLSYTLWLAPLDQSDTWETGRNLITLQWGNINPYLMSILGLMGVWPMIFACLMFADGRTQKIRAFPYFIGANATGVLCLLPYLLLRRSHQAFWGEKDQWLIWFDSRRMGIALLVTTIALFAYALLAGDWRDFVQQWHTRAFVHLISLDFCLMCLIFPITSLFDDDMARRGWQNSKIFWAVALVPLWGPLLYLCCRPPLKLGVANAHSADVYSTIAPNL
jgi:hypothetical protein